MTTLLLAYGNPGRGDDGLGPALAERIAARALPGVRVVIDYQLGIEHAADVAAADEVYFLDATVDAGGEPFCIDRIESGPGPEFSSHAATPAQVLRLASELFRAEPPAWAVGVQGLCFDPFVETLSVAGRANLDEAFQALESRLRTALPLTPDSRPNARTTRERERGSGTST